MLKNLPAMWETQVQFLGWDDPLEKVMATHSSNFICRIPWLNNPLKEHFMLNIIGLSEG